VRVSFFKILAWLFLVGAIIAAVGDSARTVATSQLVWTNLEEFLLENTAFDIDAAKLYILLNMGIEFFEIIEQFVLQAPLVVVLGLVAILSILMSYSKRG